MRTPPFTQFWGVHQIGGSSYRLFNEVHETFPKALMVRFEGVAGEFAQFDFGQVDVRLPAGRKKSGEPQDG